MSTQFLGASVAVAMPLNAENSIDPYLARVRTWDWRKPASDEAAVGRRVPLEGWLRSLEAANWEPLRYRWRNELAAERDELRFGANNWNVLVRRVRKPLEDWLRKTLTSVDDPGESIFYSVAWDLLLGWQAMVMAGVVASPYLDLLRLYESGWLPGGPSDGSEQLALLSAIELWSR